MNITDLCAELRNWFELDKKFGKFTIENHTLTVPFLQEGQYFRIVGSVFNDGVYCYDESLSLKNETFDGAIWAMAIPPACLALVAEIQQWETKNKDAIDSPYASESFGGYSYTKGSSSAGGDSNGIGWQSHFSNQLNKWRKI